MNRSLLIVLFFIVFDIRYCYSQQVTRDEAISVAQTELLYTKGVPVNITNVHQFDSNGHTLLYEVVSDRGINVSEHLSCSQYNTNAKHWSIALAAVSGVSFIAGTSLVSWAMGYRNNGNHYRSDGEGPIDLTAEITMLEGLAFYMVTIGTAIPSIILFKKAKTNAKSAGEFTFNNSHLFSNGVQCQLGLEPSGLKVIFFFSY